MSRFAQFMKANKKIKENQLHPVTGSLLGEDGKPLEWEFRHITSAENEEIRENCTYDVPVAGKNGMLRPRLNSAEYIRKLIAASVVVPDLYDEQLQNSYGVRTPEQLLMAMVDDPGEYNELAVFVQRLQGFNVSFDERIEEAKNL